MTIRLAAGGGEVAGVIRRHCEARAASKASLQEQAAQMARVGEIGAVVTHHGGKEVANAAAAVEQRYAGAQAR